ncbi:MAG: hypothetical protein QM736_18185 [Vicinamibacterales bacterium]
MKRTTRVSVVAGALAVAGAFALTSAGPVVHAQSRAAGPAYRVDPLWPQPLPNHWVWGSITGVAVDAQDHVWVVHRGGDSLEANEKGMMLTPPTSSVCCTAAPFVVELDANGKVVSSFGGPGQGYNWPQSPGSLAIDGKGNIWITAAGLVPAPATGRGAAPAGAAAPADAHVLKFSKSGQFLLRDRQARSDHGRRCAEQAGGSGGRHRGERSVHCRLRQPSHCRLRQRDRQVQARLGRIR